MIRIDGADAGGQLLRSTLALSALTQEAVRIEQVRGARSTPGVRPQHLAAIEALASVTDAVVDGAEVGADVVTFDPDPVSGGQLSIDVGTAGSASLVVDALLPLAAALDEHLAVRVGGGTDVKWSPPLDAHLLAKLPLLRSHGWGVALECHRRGFYPEGDGDVTLHLFPSTPAPFRLAERGPIERTTIRSVATDDLADGDVARRQVTAASSRLAEAGYEVDSTIVESVSAPSTGTAIVAVSAFDCGVCCGDALGKQGRPAEVVGEGAAESLLDAIDGPGAVDAHLGDQLLLPLVVAGGKLRIPERTDHVETSLALLASFGLAPAAHSDGPGGPLLEADSGAVADRLGNGGH
ncbi:RNA 3'-terminal-phosphate cyclase [Salinarchaeum sp. Harcht-Bsk1]|uniref:RNA 3'-terminal phosphate cyclase n=1 Tax=Salinarchaeum sp. Harcht-Bsk1 TaxID=1333523 RepID=UPI0003422C9C|nr:RNA 3'-terminal phosphate cyclase [Salinarchaeum sp. Harcht-Bsk1]AGN00176.1 RNA 3'-terminal-phosphate cyclase [Salinarchaeum sp. Harcht-Bsk1]